MKGNHLFLGFVLVSLILVPARAAEERLSPKISFEKTVCDLGDVGQATKNTCEFKFTNAGQGPLKITHVRRTCGCTVFELHKKEYAPGEAGVVKVSYTAGRATARMQKNIYLSTNDKAKPKTKSTSRPNPSSPIR